MLLQYLQLYKDENILWTMAEGDLVLKWDIVLQ